MELNPYALERVVATRLEDAREATRRRALVRGQREPRRVRARLGALLIHLGTALAHGGGSGAEESHSHAR